MASDFINLYVTYVDVDGDLLKVWGQKNRIGATYIERQLLQMLPDFTRSSGPDPSQIHKGMFCFAKYTDDNYYRARVISDVQGNSVGVLFVDYGNRDFIKISNVRIQQGNDDVLTMMAEQAEEYYLARVMAPQFGWTKDVVSEIRHDICYDEFRSRVVANVCDQKIVEIEFRDEDFSNYLIKKQIARPLQLPEQKQMIFSYCSLVSKSEAMKEKINFSSHVPPPNVAFKPQNTMTEPEAFHFTRPTNPSNFSKPPSTFQYPPSRHVSPSYQEVDKNITKSSFYRPPTSLINPVNSIPLVNSMMNPVLNNRSMYQMKGDSIPQFNNMIEILAQQVKQYIAQDHAKSENTEEKEPHHFVNNVFEVGSNYNVFISNIDDGPWSFSVQLVASETEIQKLMEELSSTYLVPLKPPVILGSSCIASSKLYGNLCRGVIVSISHSSVKVYFVDFGNTEDLPSSLIYELPTKFFKFPVFSQKFSLSGLEKVTYSDDIKKFFKEVVQDELLMLRVTSLKGDNLPTCELYFKDKNIKRILNEKIRELRSLNKDDFPRVGDMEDVVVTWVVSPQKFFVQLLKRNSELSELKKELAEGERKGQKIPSHQLAVGLRCICMSSSDGQWYRTVITDIDLENEITVFYVDYGNTERVNVSSLRKIEGSCLINQLNPQAIQCSLKGFDSKPFNQSINKKLEELVLEKEIKMKVVSSERELLCVQLFSNNSDLSLSLLNEACTVTNTKVPYSSETGRGKDVPPNGQVNQSRMSQWENWMPKNNRFDSRNLQNGRSRGKTEARKINDFKSKSPESWPTNQQPKKCAEDKGKFRGDKKSSNRFKNDKENQWNDQRLGRSAGGLNQENESTGSRGFRQDRGNQERRPNNLEVKGFDGDRGSRKFERKESCSERSGIENKKFGACSDRSIRNRSANIDQPKSTRKPIRQEDIAPPGTKFAEKTVEIGTCERAIITYYFNPSEFYIQLLSEEQEFKKMMQDIQTYYSDKYSLRNPVQAGDIIIAQFSVDKILYRAEVIRPIPVTVRYVDYGNRELAAAKGYWAVDKKFLKLPQQVIPCRISNLQPVDPDWPPPGSPVDKFFEREEYNCTFVGVKDGIYEVILQAVGSDTDLATEIIAAGFGQREDVPVADIPNVDYSLLPNQTLRLYVTHVISSLKFFVVIDQQRAGIVHREITAYVESKKILPPLEKSSIKPGTSCLTTFYDDSWCRGIITKVNGDSVSIWFPDRGDYIEVAAKKVKKLPDHLAQFEAQAVECCLDGVTSVEDEEFKKSVEYKHHLVLIVSAFDNKLSVVLFNENGQKSEFQKETAHPKEIQPIGDLPIVTQKLPLLVSFVYSPAQIYIQRMFDCDDLDKLINELSEFYADDKEGFNDEGIGELVAAKSIEYELWYRGQVTSSSDEGYQVFYIDYGNTETLPRDNIKKLDASFLSYPRFAKKVSLDIKVNEEAEEKFKDKLSEITLDRELTGYFVQEDGDLVCELFLNEERVKDMLEVEIVAMNETDKVSLLSPNGVSAGPSIEEPSQNLLEEDIGQQEPKVESRNEVEEVSARDSEEEENKEVKCQSQVLEEDCQDVGMKVFISHIDSPKQFWAHKESMMNGLQLLQDKLQKLSVELPKKQSIEVGSLVAVKFSGSWYRAKVVTVEGSKVTAQLIDYGNTIVVDETQNPVNELTPELLDVDVFATQYALKGTWDANATAKFEEIILSSEEPVSVVTLENGDPTLVDLFQNGKSVCEKLKEEGVACEDNSDLPLVYLTYVNSPDDFYVHRKASSDMVCALTERLLEAESFRSPSEVRENEVYVARFTEDEIWYRVRVIEKYPDEYKVYFIDYGNEDNVTEMRELPCDLADIPCLAEHCALIRGETFDVWSEDACEEFVKYSDGREIQMDVIVSRGQKSIVNLIDEGESVTGVLGKTCENDGRSEVSVTHVISPTEFYIQYINDQEYEFVMKCLERAGELEDLEDKEPGTLCIGRCVNDGGWYRAKLLKTLNEGYEVFFIDFGNESVSFELKKVPPEVKEIPPKALKCSFDLPDGNLPECVKEEFVNLTLDPRSVFRARILTPGEVNIVSLKLRGRLLEETLWEDRVSVCGGEGASSIEGTDDDKNSKLRNGYLNIEDDARASRSIANETDEEKRVKIGITVGEEGFKCDDEKGSEALSGIVNATDNELIEVSQNEDEEPEVVETVEVRLEANEEGAEDCEEVEAQAEEEKPKKLVRNEKIVPGSISRGEEKTVPNDSPGTSWRKLKHSEKLVPGSISRGISLECVPIGGDVEEEVESAPRQVSQSAPSTPNFSRRHHSNGYVKMSRSDRLVPGCISTGVSLEVGSFAEKIPSAEKIVPGAVNGSTVQ